MTHHILENRETILLAHEAEITGGIQKTPIGNSVKRLPAFNWKAETDSFSWAVQADREDDYEVTLLTQGWNAVVTVSCDGQTLRREIRTRWDRVPFGTLHLTPGVHTVTVRSEKAGDDQELYSVELTAPSVRREQEKAAARLRSDTSWMRRARYGLQFHWTSLSCPEHGPRKSYEQAVAEFDTESFADSVAETGAGYVIFTTSHAEYYIPAPIRAVDRVMPGRTASRDLIADLIHSLGRRGIRLMLYYHIGHDDYENPNGWWAHAGYLQSRERFLQNWCAIIGEMGGRYGRGLAGWFFDDASAYYPMNPDFAHLTAVAKNGNPDRVVCYNPWIYPRLTDFQDYFCGEEYRFLTNHEGLVKHGDGIFREGPQKGLQAHTNFILERNWWHDSCDTPIADPWVDEDRFVADMLEAMEYGIVPSVNLEIYQEGRFSPRSRAYLVHLRQALADRSCPEGTSAAP